MGNISDNFKDLLSKGSFARSVVMLAGGTALGQAIVVFASPILTRLYTPEDFGVLAVYSSFLGILSVVAAFRYDLAIPLPEREDDAIALVTFALLIVTLMTFVIAFGLGMCGDWILHLAKADSLKKYLWLLPIGLFVIGVYQIINYWAIRRRSFFYIARMKIVQSVTWVTMQIAVGVAVPGAIGLLLGQAAGQVAGIATLVRSVGLKWKCVSWTYILGVARKYWRFSLPLSIAATINAASMLLPPVMFNIFYGPTVAGWFHLANQSIGLPMSLIRRAVAQVYFGEIQNLKQRGVKFWRTRFVRLGLTILGIGIIPVTLIAFAAPFAFKLVFGQQWEMAGLYVGILAGMFLVDMVSYPLGQTLIMLERQDLQLIWDLIRGVVILGGIGIMGKMNLHHIHAISGYSFLMILMYFALILLAYIALLQEERKDGRI